MNNTFKKTLVGIAAAGSIATGGTFAVDAQINPYEEKGNRLEVVASSTVEDAGNNKISLEKERPAITLEKWNGEAGMTVVYEKVKGEGERAFLTDRVEWKDGKEEVHAYPLEADEEMEDGGFEIEVILNEKPDTNVFNFKIEGAEDLNFFFQGELTPQDIADGIERPENVVGSYAVYHKVKANHRIGQTNYATGKAYHIFRPKAFDADGNEMWAELLYEGGVLSVTVPQEWLDKAVYPVRVDPTFGYTTAGGSVGAVANARGNIDAGSIHTASTGDTITSYHANHATTDADGTHGFTVYTVSGGIMVNRLATPVTISTAGSGWQTSATVSQALSNGATYGVAVGERALNSINFRLDTLSGNVFDRQVSATLGATWTHADYTAAQISMYVTYTAGGGATTTRRIINAN